MSYIEKVFGKKMVNGRFDTTILMVKKSIYKDRQRGRAPHINEIKNHSYMQMKYEEYYSKINQKTESKLGDIY